MAGDVVLPASMSPKCVSDVCFVIFLTLPRPWRLSTFPYSVFLGEWHCCVVDLPFSDIWAATLELAGSVRDLVF